MTATLALQPTEAATAVAPVLRDNAAEAERLTRPTDESIRALGDAGLLDLATPRIFGGKQASLRLQYDVFSELAGACTSTAWVAAQYTVSAYLVTRFGRQAQEEFFASATPLSASSFSPTASATPVEGGFRVTGRWPFASGQHHAGWIIVSALAPGEDGQPVPKIFLVDRSEFTVADDWHVAGLAGTGSNTVSVENIFVPAHRVTTWQSFVDGIAGTPELVADPYYRVPAVPYLTGACVGLMVGVADAALARMVGRVDKRGITYTSYTKQADAAITHHQVAEATMLLDQARFHAQRIVDTVDSVIATGSDWDLATRVRCRADAGWTARRGRDVCELVHSAAGANALHLSDPLQRMVRDSQTLSVHAFFLPTSCAEAYGRVLCGLDAGTPLL